nr:hypothetical protein [Streptomyces sp. A3M-1-3]
MPRLALREGRRLTAAVAVAAISVLASACTGRTGTAADDDPKKDVTISFWHGWSAPGEVKAIQDNVAAGPSPRSPRSRSGASAT